MMKAFFARTVDSIISNEDMVNKNGQKDQFSPQMYHYTLMFLLPKTAKCWFTFAWCTCDHFLKTFSEMLVKCNFVQLGVWFGFVFFLTWFTMDSLLLTLILFIFALISNLNPHRIERHKQCNCWSLSLRNSCPKIQRYPNNISPNMLRDNFGQM